MTLGGAAGASERAGLARQFEGEFGRATSREFAVALFNHWGVGGAAANSGVLLVHDLDRRAPLSYRIPSLILPYNPPCKNKIEENR